LNEKHKLIGTLLTSDASAVGGAHIGIFIQPGTLIEIGVNDSTVGSTPFPSDGYNVTSSIDLTGTQTFDFVHFDPSLVPYSFSI